MNTQTTKLKLGTNGILLQWNGTRCDDVLRLIQSTSFFVVFFVMFHVGLMCSFHIFPRAVLRPHYTKVRSHTLPGGKTITVKAGTRVIGAKGKTFGLLPARCFEPWAISGAKKCCAMGACVHTHHSSSSSPDLITKNVRVFRANM